MPSRRRGTFAALEHPNYRLWFMGQMVSLLGTWMQMTAQGFLVYELTHSPAYLGTIGFAAGVPVWLLTLWGGVIAERTSRRNILIVTQSAMMILALILAGLTFAGVVRPWHVVLLALGLGTANAFDGPARQSFVVELVGREDLTNAIALNAMMFNIGTTVGPAVAGVVYAALGPAWCFAINGLSFIAVIVALSRMRLAVSRPSPRMKSALSELRQGLSFVAHHQSIRMLILGLAFTSLFGMSMLTTLSPAWAAKVLDGNAATNGLLLSARGLGSLAGALMIASLGSSVRRGRLRALGSLLLPLIMFVFAALRLLPLSLAALVAAWWSFMVFVNMTNALVQTLVPDELRGRVMGIYSLTFFGLMPIGALVAGTLAQRFGEPATVMVGGIVLLTFALTERACFPRMRALG